MVQRLIRENKHASCFVRVSNLVSDIKARTSAVGAGKVCGPKRKQVSRELRKPHSEELHQVWMIKSSRTGWNRHVACTCHKRNGYRVLVGKPKGKVPARRPRRTWEDNIKVEFKGNVNYINLAQDRNKWRTLVNTVMKFPVFLIRGEFL